MPLDQSHADASMVDFTGSYPGFLLSGHPHYTQCPLPDTKRCVMSHRRQVAFCSKHRAVSRFLRVGSSGRSRWAVLAWGVVVGSQSGGGWSSWGLAGMPIPQPHVGWPGFLTAWRPRAGVASFRPSLGSDLCCHLH